MVKRCACGLDIIFKLFLSLFPQVEYSRFSAGVIIMKVKSWCQACVRSSSYNCMPVLLKLHICFGYDFTCGLVMG